MYRETSKGLWNTVEIFTGHTRLKYMASYPETTVDEASIDLYSNQPITIGWWQPIGGRVSSTTDSLTATMLGLGSSLYESAVCFVVSVVIVRFWCGELMGVIIKKYMVVKSSVLCGCIYCSAFENCIQTARAYWSKTPIELFCSAFLHCKTIQY